MGKQELQVIWLLEYQAPFCGRTERGWETLGVFSSPELAMKVIADEHTSVSEWVEYFDLFTTDLRGYWYAVGIQVSPGRDYKYGCRILPLGLDEIFLRSKESAQP